MANHRKPPKIKLLENTRKDRMPKKEPESPPGIGDPPEWFGIDAAAVWERIRVESPKDLLTQADTMVVELLCQSWAEWLACQRQIRIDGLVLTTITDRGEMNKPHPLLSVSNQLGKQVMTMLSALGMTPGGRATMGVDSEKKPDALVRFMMSRDGRSNPEPEPVYKKAKPKAKAVERKPDFAADQPPIINPDPA